METPGAKSIGTAVLIRKGIGRRERHPTTATAPISDAGRTG